MGKLKKALDEMLDEKVSAFNANGQEIMRVGSEEPLDSNLMYTLIYRGRDIDAEIAVLAELKRRARNGKD